MCFCMYCVQLSVCVFIGRHTSLCLCKPNADLKSLHRNHTVPYLLRQSLLVKPRAHQYVQSSQPPCSGISGIHFLNAGITGGLACLHLHGCQGFQFLPSCLHSKWFTSLTMSPAPKIVKQHGKNKKVFFFCKTSLSNSSKSLTFKTLNKFSTVIG